MTEAPRHVMELAERRAKARAERDFASADALRAEIEQAGWLLHDTADGFSLSEKPPYELWPTVRSIPVSAVVEDRPDSPLGPRALTTTAGSYGTPGPSGAPVAPSRTADGDPQPSSSNPADDLGFSGDPEQHGARHDDMLHSQRLWDSSLAANRLDDAGITTERQRIETTEITVSVGLVVDGWPDDVRACVESVIEHTTAGILALDLGNLDGAGAVLHELALAHPDRLQVWHVTEEPHWRGGSAEWGVCRTKLLRLDTADVHVAMETSTILDGDAITPLVAALRHGAVAAGWKGAEPTEDGTGWVEAGTGTVRALMGYLLAVRRDAALGAGGFPERASYYRNADLEFSLSLPGPLVVPEETLPVRQERHRGYYDVDPGYREKESRRTYDRVLRMLRSS